MTIKELRSEFCKQKGWNYIDFETLTQAEEYIIFLEIKVNNGVLDDVIIICPECKNAETVEDLIQYTKERNS